MDCLGTVLLLVAILMNYWGSSSAAKRNRERDDSARRHNDAKWSIGMDQYYIVQRGRIDPRSVRFRKTGVLYSQASGRHLRIMTSSVDGKGNNLDEYAKLEFETVTFGSVTIRGLKAGRYLCMNKSGRLVARKPKLNANEENRKKCMFKEIDRKGKGYERFESVKHPGWFIAINKKGNVLRGPESAGKKSRTFMLRTYHSPPTRGPSGIRRRQRLRMRMQRKAKKDKLKRKRLMKS